MIADTTFLIHLVREQRLRRPGPASAFLAGNRRQRIRTSIISLAEVAVSVPSAEQAWAYFSKWAVYRLHDGIAKTAAELGRELAASGNRLGENDNWIAGFCRYYREPVISLDSAFDRVHGLRRLPY